MRIRILTFLSILTLCSLPFLANAATYHWYFSNDVKGNAVGNDTTGDGSIGKPWRTLQKAENVIKDKNSNDVVNLYFDRGDTWNFATNVLEVFSVEAGDPVVHIQAYGSETLPKPIFQGDISNFSIADNDGDNGYRRYNRVFHFEVKNCSVDNVEIKNVYGNAVFIRGGNGFTLSNSVISNVGYSFLGAKDTGGAQNVTVEHNTLHTGMQLHRFKKMSGKMWSQGIGLFAESGGPFKNNTIRYNLIYDVAGEGIAAPSSTIEYNVVGDTSSIAIDSSPGAFDTSTAIVRYNLVVMSDWSSSPYDDLPGGPNGIRVFDENAGGDNSNADISIYGNIVINRNYGIWIFNSNDTDNPFGSVKIYNNLVIDSHVSNIRLADPDEFTSLTFFNNSSILYDRTGSDHADSVTPGSGWDIDHNHFWTKGGSPNVPTAWQANHVTTDPKLPGEPALDWDGLSGSNYYHMIDFGKHLYIPPDSNLANAGKILGSDYNSTFLTEGTNFSNFDFRKISQPNSAKWCIGAIIPQDIKRKPTPDEPDEPNQPKSFRLVEK